MFGVMTGAGGIAATLFFWRSALSSGQYSRVAAALLPAVSILGLGLALLPLELEEPPTWPNVADDQGFPRLPLAWQYVILAAVLAGLANWYAIALSV
jgi:hypothetical protein